MSDLIARRIKQTDGRISAKRLLPEARAAGYQGSARNFRRAVAPIRADWRRRRRVLRPWLPTPGEHLVIDWGTEAGWQVFCAVSAWSRWRFVRFASDQRRETTLGLLAECLAALGGVPKVVLADRMACLKTGIVANVVVPIPTTCAWPPITGSGPTSARPPTRSPKGSWRRCTHSETCAVPTQRLAAERQVLRPLPSLRPPLRRGEARKVNRLATVRLGSARYSVPAKLVGQSVEVAAADHQVVICHGEVEVARHPLVAPGEASITDDHYGGPRAGGDRPSRPIRPRSQVERSFCALGPAAERFLRAAAAAGTPRLATELAAIVALAASHGTPALVAALERAATFRRFTAAGVRAVLAAGSAAPTITQPGEPLAIGLPRRGADPVPGRLRAHGARRVK